VIAKWNNGLYTGRRPQQITILPEVMDDYMDDYIVTDNPARVIEAFVNTLDMKELGSHKAEPKNIGKPPYESICYFVVYQGAFSYSLSSACYL